ncbi:hypothetical protein IWQ47_001179 [Aquimarina sp. EL_43]|uniref:hypothetical protein n=1 Tax=unclassified Aquimarina TaxID=2627091 RepID=UPI0018CADD4E|nr:MULTISPECIES: hypothetical protein [unclassified Aquimarina]MBG6129518.1 hypothetical protein [Aquimarina sp. EL_35]MBG6150583.1 hypothetical protein [Aquimarina sp. EL_32]MBG6168109.1 hypothetical protein [Aquimarina sp. EL_43]
MGTNSIDSKPILITEAEAFLDKYNTLNSNITKTPKIKSPEVDELIKNKSNAFAFKAEHIQSLIGKGKADYIVVILGAHNVDIPEHKLKAGSFTVMALGYTKDENYLGDEIKLNIIKKKPVAYQYPPKAAITGTPKIKVGKDGERMSIEPTLKEDQLIFEKNTGNLFMK